MPMTYTTNTPNSSGSGSNVDKDIAKRVAQITSENSPIMQQARTTGLQQANRRGLSNSSMAVGASQAEAIRAASPIASQEANLAASNREANLNALTGLSAQRMNAIAATLQNPELPAEARVSALRSYNDQFSQIANYLQNLYGVRLNQNAPGAPTAAPTPNPTVPTPAGVPTMSPGYYGSGITPEQIEQLRGLSLA